MVCVFECVHSTKKPMFCNNCQQFNHTATFCKRKPKCALCHEQHATSACENPQIDRNVCPYCQTRHTAGAHACPHFAEVNERFKQMQARKYASPDHAHPTRGRRNANNCLRHQAQLQQSVNILNKILLPSQSLPIIAKLQVRLILTRPVFKNKQTTC